MKNIINKCNKHRFFKFYLITVLILLISAIIFGMMCIYIENNNLFVSLVFLLGYYVGVAAKYNIDENYDEY